MSLFTRMPRSEFQHSVICGRIVDPVFAESIRRCGVEVHEIGFEQSIFNPLRFMRAAKVARSYRPDIIHGAILDGYLLSSIVGFGTCVPVSVMEETSDPQNRRWKGHVLSRGMAAMADHCIGVSDSVGRYLTDTIRVPKNKVTVIRNGVEKPRPSSPARLSKLRTDLGIDTQDIVIGTVARFSPEKRFDILLKAFSALTRYKGVRLLVVGDGDERRKIESWIEELRLEDRVILVGAQSHVADFYALMDIFALASEHEAFGMVNAEAMRLGLPVVATRVGGIPEVVLHGMTGRLVPPGDVEAMAKELSRLIEDEGLRKTLGAAGRAFADDIFSAERYVNEMAALYRRLCR